MQAAYVNFLSPTYLPSCLPTSEPRAYIYNTYIELNEGCIKNNQQQHCYHPTPLRESKLSRRDIYYDAINWCLDRCGVCSVSRVVLLTDLLISLISDKE